MDIWGLLKGTEGTERRRAIESYNTGYALFGEFATWKAALVGRNRVKAPARLSSDSRPAARTAAANLQSPVYRDGQQRQRLCRSNVNLGSECSWDDNVMIIGVVVDSILF